MIAEFDFLQRIVLMLAMGLIIGLERERKTGMEKFSGVRTFVLGGMFGLLSVYIGSVLQSYITVMIAFILIGLLTAFGYYAQYRKSRVVGGTTEVAFLIIFLIGVFSYFDIYPFFLTIALGLVTTLILASKEQLHRFSQHLTTKEILSAVVFVALTFLILPALPNRAVDPWGAINPYRTWLALVLVMSVGFISYMLMKIFGADKGLFITGILGGIASSTAVAVDMSSKARQNAKMVAAATFAVMVASSIMFIRQSVWVIFINPAMDTLLLLKLVAVGVVGCALSYMFWKGKGGKENVVLDIGSPLTLKPAIRFTLVYLAVTIAASFVKGFGATEVYILAFVSGLIDVDAATISFAQMSITGMSPALAINGMLVAAVANTMTKWFLVNWLGTKRMMFEVGRVFIFLIILSAFLTMF